MCQCFCEVVPKLRIFGRLVRHVRNKQGMHLRVTGEQRSLHHKHSNGLAQPSGCLTHAVDPCNALKCCHKEKK